MKIHRNVSEKRTYRTVSDEFISREFSAGQDIDVPDDAPHATRMLMEVDLMLHLKTQVLMGFLLEQMITTEEFNRILEPYRQLQQAAESAAHPQPAAAA
jgi:hypothetical protein